MSASSNDKLARSVAGSPRRDGHLEEGDMKLTALARTVLIDRLLVLEKAAHATACPGPQSP